MKTVIARIEGVSPYSQSKAIQSPRNGGNPPDAHEQRTWRERMHVDENGIVFIPPMAIKNMLSDCARFLSESVPGKGKATYTKHFEAGIMVLSPASIGVKADEVKGETLYVPSNGVKGGGKRVFKTFPFIPKWSAELEIIVIDPTLESKLDKVEEYLRHAKFPSALEGFVQETAGFMVVLKLRNLLQFK